jgi:sugar phosphate isomerase/epimerase
LPALEHALMKLSFTTLGCPDWSLEQIASNAKTFGFDGVELRTHDDGNHLSPDVSTDQARRVAQMFRDSGVPVFSVMGYTRFAHVDAAEVARNVALMRKLIGVAEAMGAKYIRTFAGKLPPGVALESMIDKVGTTLKPLADEAAKRGVTIGVETHDDWCAGDVNMKLVSIINNKKGFGVIYDVMNAINASGEAWTTTYEKIKSSIVYCHAKDGYKSADGKSIYMPFGAGTIPWSRILQTLKRDSFDSYFSFEWEKKWHPELENPERVFPAYTQKMKALWNDA